MKGTQPEMFNKDSRTKNTLRTSVVTTICNLVNSLMAFVYRTVFIYVLSSAYLGVSGLFTNILQMLSLAELGITSAISYRFYKPISENNTQKVGELMRFYKRVYQIIACTIVVLGMAVFPFLNYLIKDASEVPSDINIHLVYVLYLLQTVSSYTYAYKQTILTADQRHHILAIFQTLMKLANYVIQIIVLVCLRNFTLSLGISVAVTIGLNAIVSYWVTLQYKDVFSVKGSISKAERQEIFEDTKATICHKIGWTVLNGTDSLILSKFVGLIATGLYSNYAMIINNLSTIVMQLFGSFTSSLGNAHVELDEERKYVVYKRLLFANLWIAGYTTVCLFCLIDDFIAIWIGKNMLLDTVTVITLSIQFYLEMTRKITTSYTNGCGLFVKDKIRPLIEAAINVVVSIVLVKAYGIAGVFMGTIVSHLLTVFWREPYILFKYEFHKSTLSYWIMFAEYGVLTTILCIACSIVKNKLFITNNALIAWIANAIIISAIYFAVSLIVFGRTAEFGFYKEMVCKKLKRQK